jgi:hypothetical protein
MQGILSKGYAKIAEKTANGRYIPHQGIYHPKKQKKLGWYFNFYLVQI